MFVRKFDHHILLLKAAVEIPNSINIYIYIFCQFPSYPLRVFPFICLMHLVYLKKLTALKAHSFISSCMFSITPMVLAILVLFELQENRRRTFPHFCLNVQNEL